MFITDYGVIPNLADSYYSTCTKKVRHMPVAIRASKIVPGDKLLYEGKESAAHTLHEERHYSANVAIAQIHPG
jgi:hypothetical protein